MTWDNLKKVQELAKIVREKYLWQLAEHEGRKNNTTEERAYQNITNREHLRSAFQKIRWTLNLRDRQGL